MRQPEQQAPPVQRLRIRYAKRGRARFSSHRDFARAFERALRRADVPMAFSSGFSPHPRISYANGAPTGTASEAEYLEIGVAAPCDPERVRQALDAALPDGLDVLAVVEAWPGSLADALQGSRWRLGVGADWSGPVAGFLDLETCPVERMTKTGMKTFDARPAVRLLVAEPTAVALVLEHGTPLVRPEDVLRGLIRCGAPAVEVTSVLMTRQAQGPLDGADVGDPFCSRG